MNTSKRKLHRYQVSEGTNDRWFCLKKQKQMTDGNAWKPLPHADTVQIHDMIQR